MHLGRHIVKFAGVEHFVEKIVEIEGIVGFFKGHGDCGIGQVMGNIVNAAGRDGGADQKCR